MGGEITTPEGIVPLRIGILTDHRVEIRLGEAADTAPVTAPGSASESWDLSVSTPQQLPTADARLNSPHLAVHLRAERNRLVGRAVAFKDGDREGRLGAYLVHPCELNPR